MCPSCVHKAPLKEACKKSLLLKFIQRKRNSLLLGANREKTVAEKVCVEGFKAMATVFSA
jgi:hypothetical protein